MPPIVYPDNCGVFSFVFEAPGAQGEVMSTLGFQADHELVQSEIDIRRDFFVDNVIPLIAANYGLAEVRVIQQQGEEQQEFVSVSGANGSGDDPVPLNTSVLVAKLTDFSGRANRGRMFIPGVRVGELEADGNTLTAGNLVFWQDAFDTFFAGFSDIPDLTPVIHHRATATFTQMDSFAVRARLATQRGRLRD